jgi:hypothetical protein
MNEASSRLLEETPEQIAGRLMQRAHNQDGLPEIVIGLLFLLTAGLDWVQMVSRPRSVAYVAAILGLAILLPILMLGSPWAIKRLRRHYLVARLGYVEFKPVRWKRFWVVFGIAYVAAFVGAFAFQSAPPPPDSWVLAATGVVGGALMAFAGRLPRYFIGGMLMAAAGIVVAASRVPMVKGFAMLFGFAGLLSLLSGCVVLFLFMRKPAEGGE